MKHEPLIKSVMTPFPYSIDIDAPIHEAKIFMRKEQIRHLPVMEGGRLAGLLSDRDIKLYLGPDMDYPGIEETKVRDVYVDEPYIVDLNTPLRDVLLNMSEMHIGSVLVTKNENLVGLFTATDACRGFAEHLAADFPQPGGDEAA